LTKRTKGRSGVREHTGPHHILPTSRGGVDRDNIYPNDRWPPASRKHDYWHILFVNMKPEEVMEKIREYSSSGTGNLKESFFNVSFSVVESWYRGEKKIVIKTTKRKYKAPREKAWLVVFGDMNGHEAIEWIEQEFIRKEWLNK